MLAKNLAKLGWLLVFLIASVLFGCDGGSSSGTDDVNISKEAEINPAVLDSAAGFLAAATGKGNPITIDQVIFVNEVLGMSLLDREDLSTATGQDSSMGMIFGDLWVMLRDEYGVPILDSNGCEQPIASEPIELPLHDDEGFPVVDEYNTAITYLSDTVPMSLEEYMDGEFKCEIVAGYEDYVIAVEMGRLNMVRSSVNYPDTMSRALEEAIKNINASVAVKTDLAGRLVLVSEQDVLDEEGNVIDTELIESTIDAPRDNLALYRALMYYGRLVGFGVETRTEEGEVIPAPWLEIRPDLDLGELSYLRDGTKGRSHGVGLSNGYPDLSAATHSTSADYAGKQVDYVQYHYNATCAYTDETDDVWNRVFNKKEYQGDNIRGFAAHADDARKMIVFMHNVIQDVPNDGVEPELDVLSQIDNQYHGEMSVGPDQKDRHLMFEVAASALGAASNKGVPVTVDSAVFVNTLLGVNHFGELTASELYGDLWVLKRNEDGVPLRDNLGCVMPVASKPIIITTYNVLTGEPMETEIYTVPMVLEEYMNGEYQCAPMPGFEEYVVEVELGRLNCVRSTLNNTEMLGRHLYDVVERINASVAVKRDLAGRLVLTTEKETIGEDGTPQTVLVDSTIDSPLENLAIYRALMTEGTLEVTVTIQKEGTTEDIALEIGLDVEVLNEHGLGFLKRGQYSYGTEVHANGFADFSENSHNPQADYNTITLDFVERWDDPTCAYQAKTDEVWTRILDGEVGADGEDESPAKNLAAFVQHADNTRRVIVFMHTMIQDPVIQDPVVE